MGIHFKVGTMGKDGIVLEKCLKNGCLLCLVEYVNQIKNIFLI